MFKTKSYWSVKGESQSNLNLSRGNLDLVQDFSRMVNKSFPYMKDINKDIVRYSRPSGTLEIGSLLLETAE